MVESERKIVADADELEKLFKPEITGGVISDKLVMPIPGDEGILVRFLYVKDKDGKLGVVDRVKNPKFKNPSEEAEFMNVEMVNKDGSSNGVEKRMGLGESMKNSIRRLMNDEHWKAVDLPGKVVHITGSWWANAPANKRDPKAKCKACGGVGGGGGVTGCKVCSGTGIQPHPIVFNVRARHDLMSGVGAGTGKRDEF